MATLSTKYLDHDGLRIFLSKIKEYISTEISKISGEDLKLYDNNANNPTITSQLEAIWELLGSPDGSSGGSLIESIQTVLDEYVKNISVPGTQELPLKLQIVEGTGDNKDKFTISLVDNGLTDKLNSPKVDSIAVENAGGDVTLNVNNSTGAVTVSINSKGLSDTVAEVKSNLATEITNRTNADASLNNTIAGVNERLSVVEESYVKTVKVTGSNGMTVVPVTSTKGDVNITISGQELENKIQALSLGMKLTGSVSPTVIYKNTAYTFTFAGVLTNPSGFTIDSMKVKDNSSGTEYVMNVDKSNSNRYTYSLGSQSMSGTSKSYTITASASGLTFVSTVSVNARYPVYCGMGASATEVMANSSNKLTARTSAAGTYTLTANKDDVRFYLLVPSDVTRPTSFTMGGAPVDMVKPSTPETINGISYYVLYTNAMYKTGAKVEIKAS